MRYPLSLAQTVAELWRMRGGLVFVQNPSQVLAVLACLFKKPFGYTLVVDRHSNFPHLWPNPNPLRRAVASALSAFSVKRADITLITNGELLRHVESLGGRGFILPDPFPELGGEAEASVQDPEDARNAKGRPAEILFVSSWACDEPIAQAIEACRLLQGEVVVRISGRMKPAYADLVASAPPNFRPTGFLGDRDYFALMAASDAVMAVTDRQATLVCGAYEAAALGKPLILGDAPALREYFHAGAVYTDCSAEDLAAKIRALLSDLPRYREDARRMRKERESEWEQRLEALEGLLVGLPGNPHPARDGAKAPGPGR